MATCRNCGKTVQERFCPGCGLLGPQSDGSVDMERRILPPVTYEPDLIVPPMQHPIRLKDEEVIPIGQLSAKLRDIRDGGVTDRGHGILEGTDEEMIWNATPSLLSVAELAAKWGLAVLIAAFVACTLRFGYIWIFIWLFVGAIQIGLNLLGLSSTRYRATTQRLELTDGMLHQQTRTYETHQLGDAVITSPFLMRFFGLSVLTVRHQYGTEDGRAHLTRIFAPPPADYIPRVITLVGLDQRECVIVRDLLRGTGQLESERTDKIRWRQ